MKKKLLFLLGGAFLGGLFSLNLSAQTDVTSTYITNPGFEEASEIHTTFQEGTKDERDILKPNGWTVVLTNPNQNDFSCLTSSDKQAGSFSSSYTMNHSGDKTYWVRLRWGGQVWKSSGTEGSPTSVELQQIISLPNGVYRLSADLLHYAGGTEENNHTYLTAQSSNNSWSVEPTKNHSKSDANWENKSLLITSSGATEYTVLLKALQNWNQGAENIFAFDDVKLEKFTIDADNTFDLTSIVSKGTANWTNKGANNTGTFSNGGVDMVERYYKNHYTGTVSELFVKDLPLGVYDAEVYCQAHCADWECTAISEAAGQTDRTILSANAVEVGIPIVNDRNLTEGPQVRTLSSIKVTDGTLTFKVRNDQEGANWLTFEVKSLTYKGVDLTEIKASYNTAKIDAETARDNAAYASITGAERTALVNAISAPVNEDADSYIAATNALIAATAPFNATTVANYTLLETEKTKAAALGMTNEAIANETPNTKTGLQALQDLKVAEYNFVTTTYQYGVELGSWTTEGPTGSKSDQHYKGAGNPYLEQSTAAWESNAWTIKYSQDVTLPAGDYVFKVAGRQADNDGVTLSLEVKNGETTLGTVSDFPKGDTGLGINKNGATDFTTGEGHEYVNSGAGRGWEWRYVKFSLDADAKVNVAVNAVATTSHMWVSFCDATVQSDDALTGSKIAYNVVLEAAKAVDQTAPMNADVLSALQVAIATDVSGYTEADQYTATVTELETAKNNATASIAAYAKVKNAIDKAEAVVLVGSTLDISSYKTAYTNRSMLDVEADDNIAAIEAALRTALCSQPLPASVTALIINPSFEEGTDVWADGWTTSRNTTGTFDYIYKSDDSASDPNNFKDGSRVLNAWASQINFINKTQDVTLNKGYYTLSAAVYTDGIKDQRVIAKIGEDLFESPIFDSSVNEWQKLEVSFPVNTDNTSVTIGIYSSGKNQNGNSDGWFRADNFQLTYLGPDAATMSITAAKYATFIAPFDVTIPADVTASTVELNADGTTLDLTPVTTTILANTPVVLQKDVTDTFTQTFYGVATNTTNEYTVGVLTGTYTEITASAGSYILNKIDDWVGFAKVAEGNTTLKVGANRCYIKADAVTPAPFFRLGGTTNITNVENAEADAAVYDLTGRRVDAPAKGIYIVNGKKVLVK